MTFDFTNKSDREKLHELVKKTIEGHRNNIKLELTVNSLKCIERLIETQERIIEEQEERIAIMSEDGWVSVDDHLPDKGKPCFITYYYQNPYAGEGYAVYQGFVGLSEDGEWVDTDGDEISPYLVDVTHWQYANIPEPPKEGET